MSAILLNATVCDFSSPPPLPFAEAMGIHIIYLFIHALHFTRRPHSYTYSEYIACLAWAWFFSSCTKWILNIIKLNANEKDNNKNMNRKKKKICPRWKLLLCAEHCYQAITVNDSCALRCGHNKYTQTNPNTHHSHNKLYGHEFCVVFFSACFVLFYRSFARDRCFLFERRTKKIDMQMQIFIQKFSLVFLFLFFVRERIFFAIWWSARVKAEKCVKEKKSRHPICSVFM